MSWNELYDTYDLLCYINDEEQTVLYLKPSALRHHNSPLTICEMWDGIELDYIIKPDSDPDRGSILSIVTYLDTRAELGYNVLDEVPYADASAYDIPITYEAVEIFHAWCADDGRYDHADFTPVEADNGITLSWIDIMNFYDEGGHYE